MTRSFADRARIASARIAGAASGADGAGSRERWRAGRGRDARERRGLRRLRHGRLERRGRSRPGRRQHLDRPRAPLRPPRRRPGTPERADTAARHRERFQRSLRPAAAGFAPHHAIDVVRKALPRDGILAFDVGAHTHQIASQWTAYAPGTFLITNGWSSMGFGLPAAIAAKLARPERAVVALVGDGCFQMTCGEVASEPARERFGLRERRVAVERDVDMEALDARRLHEADERAEGRADRERGARAIAQTAAGTRIEIDTQLVRMVQVA